jgi:hypothetical protein
MKLSLPPKLVEKTSLSPSYISFCEIFIPSQVFDALICQDCPFSPPNHETLMPYYVETGRSRPLIAKLYG